MAGQLSVGADGRSRCAWCGVDPLYVTYHDEEWGRPPATERELFELLTLEGMQAGLSWLTILRKREGFRDGFHRFEPSAVAAMSSVDVEALLQNPGIVRHRGKIEATIGNAAALLTLYDAGQSLSLVCERYRPPARPRKRPDLDEFVSSTPESEALSKQLRGYGFRFVGPTIVYAFFQAAGFVDDHLEGCCVEW